MGTSGEKWEKKLPQKCCGSAVPPFYLRDYYLFHAWDTMKRYDRLHMFIGEYHYVLDDKGRLSVPIGYRTELLNGAIVTRGLDHSLFLYPKTQWESLAAKIAALPLSQADTRAFARLMLAGAMEASIDKSGRITIPEYLRVYAGLTKKVVISGLYDRMEIWDEDAWNSYAAKTEANGNEIAERLGPIGL